MELELINKLFLELSQVATARTAREIAAEELAMQKVKTLDSIWDAIEKVCPERMKSISREMQTAAAVPAKSGGGA